MKRRTQILTWAVILLLITNAVTIATILYHNYKERKNKENITITAPGGTYMINGRFLRRELGFDQSQMDEFRRVNQEFRPLAMLVTNNIDSLKEEMFTELRKNKPDTVKLDNLSEMIGQLHGQLKHETYTFYLQLKNICSPEQQAELENAFLPLFKSERMTTPPGQHRRKGWNRD
jgi:Spy/CpxP family protein refolding chaperone